MILIAHRGNIRGPDEMENHPGHITAALDSGFHVEADIRWVAGKYLLGHDEPQYELGLLNLRDRRIWWHAKDVKTLVMLTTIRGINCFYLPDDVPSVVVTSEGYVWTYKTEAIAGTVYGNDSTFRDVPPPGVYGVCSDYVLNIREKMYDAG